MIIKIYFFHLVIHNAYQMSIFSCFMAMAVLTTSQTKAQVVSEVGFVERGRASYFADDRGGVYTSSGERYNQNALVAAHPYIAFNSYVKVTNLDNGNTVIVRINDRSEGTNRIIDLSKEAANRLGVLGNLYFDVKLEIISNPTRSNPDPTATNEYQAGVPPVKTDTAPDEVVKPTSNAGSFIITPTEESQSVKPTATDEKEEKPKPLEERFNKVGTYELDGSPVKPLGYGVQVGWFTTAAEASRMGQRFSNLQFGSIYIQSGWEEGKKAYRVLLGNYAKKEDTKDMIKFLNERHYNAFARKHYGLD